MSGTKGLPKEDFGFARRSPGGVALLSADVPVEGHQEPDNGQGVIEPKTAQIPTSGPSKVDLSTEDEFWVVRPKRQQAREDKASPLVGKPLRRPGYSHLEAGSLAPSPEHRAGGRRWLAFCLAGMVYVTGIAGLWSMVQRFDGAGSPSITPADSDKSLPPLDHQVDIQDARLDGPIIPRFRPEVRPGDGEDVANSDLQKKI